VDEWRRRQRRRQMRALRGGELGERGKTNLKNQVIKKSKIAVLSKQYLFLRFLVFSEGLSQNN
jgi:hypothetical protein